jgi:hypothetical protein
MSNNIYNILGKLKTLTESAEPAAPEATVYETVEARGSISEAVKSLEGKYAAFKEAKDEYKCILPDGSDDVLFTGTKAECEAWASKGDKDVKIVKEAKKAKPDFLDVDKDGDKKEPFKKAVKDKKAVKEGQEEWYDKDGKVNPNGAYDAAGHYYLEREVNEGQGPYELYNPKHPKFKANHDKWMKKNPGKKLADFVAAMKKKEATMNEAAYDEPEAPDADAIAKRKRLQAIKDRQEDERAERGENKPESNVKIHKGTYGNEYKGDADLDEVAPPGAKAERMVKHIKKGYAKDGNLSKKEKGIAYATAWKAKKAGNLEEGTEFKDAGKIKNSAPNMKKAKLAKVTESRMLQEGDYFYEKIGKALAEKDPTLDTANPNFVSAVRQEMIAQGIEPNRARNIIAIDEDFISDVASSYAHYCKEVSEAHAPMNSHLGGASELDEIARLAGLPVQETDTVYNEVNYEESADTMDEGDELIAPPKATPGKAPSAKATGMAPARPGVPPTPTFNEEEVEEGNEFSGALAAAKASGAKEFEVDGKKYTVKEDINVNITANGQEDALNLFRKLAGMDEVVAQPAIQAVGVTELPQDLESALAQGVIEPVEEERDIEYANTPNEKIGPVSAAIPSGDDMHKSKQSYSDKPYRGDNPMAVKEDTLWKKYAGMLKGLIK